MANLDEYQHLWDGSEQGWILRRIRHIVWRITIHFDNSGPKKNEILRMREICDEFRNQQVGEVWRSLRRNCAYALKTDFGNIEMHALSEKMERLGLKATFEPIDRSRSFPVSSDGMALLIDDDTMADRVAQKMISAGVPVEEVEVD